MEPQKSESWLTLSTRYGVFDGREHRRHFARWSFPRLFVRQGGTDHAALEILDVETNAVLPDTLPAGFCSGFVFVPDATGFYYSHRETHDSRPYYKAVLWHRYGTARSLDTEVFVADEKPDVFLGILDSMDTKLLAYVVYTIGTRPRTSLYLHSMLPGAAPTLLLATLKDNFLPSSCEANYSRIPTSTRRMPESFKSAWRTQTPGSGAM